MILDMHTHTNQSSCGVMNIQDMIEIAAGCGLDGICITDHQTMAVRHYITEGPQANGLVVIFGMEYETPDGDFLIFGPYEHIAQKMEADELLNYVRQTHGVAVAAHPFRGNRPASRRFLQNRQCTAIETMNGRNSEIENLKAVQWADRLSLTATGGSDAHKPDELGRIVTRFPAPVRSRDDLIQALYHGLCRPEWRMVHAMAQ